MKRKRAAQEGERRFTIHTFLAKAYKDDAGGWWLDGIASGPQLDLQDDRMSPAALESMRSQCCSGQIPLRKSHWGDWDEEMGYLREGTIDAGGELKIRAMLDSEMEYCRTLIRKLEGDAARGVRPRKLGLSIGGYVPPDGYHLEASGDRICRVIDKIELDHVAVTSRPAYAGAVIDGVEVKSREFARHWVLDVAKSVAWPRTADPAMETPAPPAGGSDQAGGTDMKNKNPLLRKQEEESQPPPPPPPEGEGQEPEKEEEEPAYKNGTWVPVTEVKEGYMVWAQIPQPDAAPPPPPAEGGTEEGKSEMDEQALKALNDKIDALTKSVETLTALKAQAEAEQAQAEGVRKGLANDDAKGQEQARQPGGAPPSGNYIEALKASQEYRDATPQARTAMLGKAVQEAAKQRQS